MKKIFMLASLLLMFVGFSSCETDNDDNPVLHVPASFELLQPTIGLNEVDLESSSSITLKAKSAPEYGFPTQVTYGAQVALANQWDNADAIYTVDGTSSSISLDVLASEIDKAIMKLNGYTEASQVPDEAVTVYVRMSAMLVNDADSTTLVYSNAQPLVVKPYFMELTNADPAIWWLVGGIIGDGAWTNTLDGRGPSMCPMWTISGESYDAKTGEGKIQYIGYFSAGSFKILETVGNWNYGMCGGTENGDNSYRDGGDDPGNITVGTAGYYTLTVNTAAKTMEMTPYTEETTEYSIVNLSGSFNSWGDEPMQPFSTFAGVEHNHDWYATITLAEGDEVKFKIDSWDMNWGNTAFPNGKGTKGGENIKVTEAGTYLVFLNDITGQYTFIKK